MPLYDRIGNDYDQTRRADPYIASRLIHHLQPVPGKKYLDVACGTGNYTISLASAVRAEVHGIDLSDTMLRTAREKSNSVQWHLGDVERLPFPDDSFDGSLCILAIHHVKDHQKAFEEVYRVIASGRFVLFTATPEQMKRYWLNHYFPDAMEKAIRQMPSFDHVRTCLVEAGFTNLKTEPYCVTDKLEDLFIYAGKHRPHLYLDPVVREGISTFSNLADRKEIESGCEKLAQDIESGNIKKVIEASMHKEGDYLFAVTEKNVD